MFSTLAYALVEALASTDWVRAQAGSIRLRLLKVGAVVRRNTRRIAVHLSSSYPYRKVFEAAHAKLRAPG